VSSFFRCIKCRRRVKPDNRFRCSCGGLFEVEHEFGSVDKDLFDKRFQGFTSKNKSGVWRFKELIHPGINDSFIQSRPEGNTNIYRHQLLTEYTGIKSVFIKHEGENPTGSFKDRGMTVGISEAKRLGAKVVACASTGNTSASLSSYSAFSGLDCLVFIPEGEIAYGKLAQALAYGAKVVQVKGNFDDSMNLVQEASEALGFYLLNSVNPWRIEGQKTIIYELLQQRKWNPPDWIVFPAGNLGNTSAFGKALRELLDLNLIDSMPRLAAVQADGANPFYKLWSSDSSILEPLEKPLTIASAIKIGKPISWEKAIRSIIDTKGVVEQVSDQDIMDAKAIIDRSGIGCEPASAASVSGARKMVESGMISRKDDVVCILTGNLLKDPESSVNYHMGKLQQLSPKYANNPVVIEPDLSSLKEVLEQDPIILVG
jgi:threonine synthase